VVGYLTEDDVDEPFSGADEYEVDDSDVDDRLSAAEARDRASSVNNRVLTTRNTCARRIRIALMFAGSIVRCELDRRRYILSFRHDTLVFYETITA